MTVQQRKMFRRLRIWNTGLNPGALKGQVPAFRNGDSESAGNGLLHCYSSAVQGREVLNLPNHHPPQRKRLNRAGPGIF